MGAGILIIYLGMSPSQIDNSHLQQDLIQQQQEQQREENKLPSSMERNDVR